ncbi:MAG: hypothetical protein ACRDMJ_20510 [Solirubrobacteraceae bacterium]
MVGLLISGCGPGGSSGGSAVTATGSTLTIYASQPPAAARTQAYDDVIDAERMAFSQGGAKAGRFKLSLQVLDGAKLSENARTAIQDKSSIAYLGELAPGTTPQSVEITNQLDLLQVSPTDTAVYLTQASPILSGSPGRFYPLSSSYHLTFARVVPNTAQEAHAIVGEMQSLKLSKLYVADDGTPYGASIAHEVRADAPSHGLTVVQGAAGADAVFYGGSSAQGATRVLGQAASTAPSAKLFVPSALYSDTFAAGLSSAAQGALYVSTPGFSSGSLPSAGQQFVSSFRSAYGHAPAPEAIFGYEAMSAVLAVLRQAGAHANDRSTVVSDFESLKNRSSVLGTYSIKGGDTTIAPFVFARLKGGHLVVPAHG